MPHTDDHGYALIATLGPMLPLPLVTAIMRVIADAAEATGCRKTGIGDGLEIKAILPAPGTRTELHAITIGPSGWHPQMYAWTCSCLTEATSSYGDPGGAFTDALAHIPDGDTWTAHPTKPRTTN
ncbi:hypothetical protein [Actinoplanes sp. NBRC 101535]|uniref:hypothetical protein n=1 Tax=Actinoplanes sp. NBRC 101535 TaxID=3032196 RepID=UPI0024A3A96C|nr:hypothetical protein [Actinoplanes sp. NBRC 101535]GLY08290.1 hypothetical protein Acsp01_86690 [Actinoplanes sp. NBRC 101535]